MSGHTFATKRGKAYYWNSIPAFIHDPSDNIIGQLVRHSFEINNKTNKETNNEQFDAWKKQISELQNRLNASELDGDIIFEYDIVRLGKRIDVILLIRHMVFSLEFKNGKEIFTAQDAQQAEDYALDIKNFHKESEDLYVCPILIATAASPYAKPQSDGCYPDKQVHLQRENIDTVIPKVNSISEKYGDSQKLDFEKWFNSPYYPTPTIIAAAVAAYTSHNMSEIAQSEAGQANIDLCEAKLTEIITYAREKQKKCICFVTGVPGAGKTLVGLDIVAKNLERAAQNPENRSENLSVYLSGNGPLVDVLREALKRSVKINKQYTRETDVSINALIQSSYNFKREYANKSQPIPEHILLFDEAQRVWNKEKMQRKHDDPAMAVSEPQLLLSIMDRHQDWGVMICLVGLGQDIYDGEVGINEWFRCAIEEYPDWEMFYSPEIFTQSEDRNIDRMMIESCPRCHAVSDMHLKTSIRSFRADKQCQLVDNLLDNNPKKTREIYSEIAEKYPVFVTRDYKKAKEWVRMQVRGSQRSGVLACSSAQRLKPEGIYVPTEIDVKNWFLAPSDDLRSSNKFEVVASEFKVQGLEIDWAIVCWDADLRRSATGENWDHYTFRGTKWMKRNKPEQKRYLVNSYRVLLTRARQGMVIFVPLGVDPEEDATRDHEYYDRVYEYLKTCGIRDLP